MSTATLVPETWELTGDDAKETLARTDRTQLAKDAFTRLRFSDGFSHARSMAFLLTLVFVQAVIAAIGIASALGSDGWFSDSTVDVLQTIVPGPAGRVLTTAVEQAHRAGSSGRWVAIAFGTIGALITGTTLIGQIERALNRLYGVEKDRDTVHKYGQALLLAVTAGVMSTLAFAGLALGQAIASSLGGAAGAIWNVARWPLAIGLLLAAIALIFRWAPRRHQPEWAWLSFGAAVSVTLLALVSIALNLFFQIGSTFGTTYGPLAGIVALTFWAFFSSLALLIGAALAAQLEAVRAGAAGPRSSRKTAESEPRLSQDTDEAPIGMPAS